MQAEQGQVQRRGSAETSHLPDLLGDAFDSLPSALVLFNRRLGVVVRNQAAKALLPDEPDVPRLLSRLALETGYQDWTSEVRKVLDGGLPLRLEVAAKSEGERPDLDITIRRLCNSRTGETAGGCLLAEDVTSRASMERRLAISERLAAVGKLAARVAHELNNPLDGILRYTNMAVRISEALDQGSPDGESPVRKMIGYLRNARTGIVRMTEIITSLLEFSRNTPNSLEQASINKIIEDAVTAMCSRAEEAGVTVVCNLLEEDTRVGRGSNLFQVFCNLIKNAVEAMRDGGTLTITARSAKTDAVVTFEDTGVGLPQQADKIFEPFFTTKAPGKGTGLGLAVCRELIEKYSGTVTAANRTPCGAVFTVTLPLARLAAGPAVTSTQTRVGEQ